MQFSKHVLENGLRVVLVPMIDTETVTVEILVEAGSKYENKKNNGISHFLEHMMFKGTKNRPSAKIISETLDSVGGQYNAFTGQEETGYWVKVPANHFELALNVVSDMYQNPLLSQKEIDTERGVILQEEAMYRDTPVRYVADLFDELLYGDQPAGWKIVGPPENIKRFDRADFEKYLDQMYLPSSTVVTIAGKIEPKKTLGLVKKYFQKPENGERKKTKKKVLESQNRPALKIMEKKTDQTHLILGFRSIDMFNPGRFTAAVLSAILGGGMSSRMFLNIRERHGLTYYIGADLEMATDSGYLYVRAGVEHGNLEKTVRLILKEIEKVSERKVSQKELKKAKEYIKGNTLMSLESSSARASFFGNQELFRKELKNPKEYFEKIDRVTAEDVQRLVKKTAKNKNLNLAVIGPQKKREGKLREILR